MPKRKLRPYQVDMLRFLQDHASGALFAEMRLGKTIVAIRWARFSGLRRILVVSPNSALESWVRELAMEDETDIAVLVGDKKRRRNLFRKGFKWNLINREGFRALPEIGSHPWDAVILDESASCIRYPDTQITKFFLQNFKSVDKKVLLAGRPDPQNTLLAYWPQMAFLSGGEWMRTKNYYHFRYHYFQPVFYDFRPKPGAREKIQLAVSQDAFVLSRKDVGLDTFKVFEPRSMSLPKNLYKKYLRAEREFILETEKGEKWSQWALVRHQWLRQLATGYLEKKRVWSGAVKEAVELVKGELSDESLVFCFSYQHEVDDVEKELRSEGVTVKCIHGGVNVQERMRIVSEFRDRKFKILLAQVRTIDTGADLPAADTICYFSLPFSVLTWTQSQDRILGDLTKKKVMVVPFITKKTVAEDIYQTLELKNVKGQEFLDEVRERMVRRHKGVLAASDR